MSIVLNRHQSKVSYTIKRKVPLKEILARRLNERHLAELRASAISDRVIWERGYRTVTDPQELINLGFAPYQCIVPGILMPVHHVPWISEAGEKLPLVAVFKPDNPRFKEEGKLMKYENPAGFRACLDVPPRVKDLLKDPTVPLVITEGVKKTDSAVSHGLACVGLQGVWSWHFDDWNQIEWSHRRVYICFDSDVVLKKEVADALKKLRHFLRSMGATVVTIFLPDDGSKKTGLDDYFASGKTVDELLLLTKRKRTDMEIREDLPTIETHKHGLEQLVDQSIEALVEENDPPEVFVHLGRLVRVRTDEVRHRLVPRVEAMNKDMIINRLSQVANFITVNQGGRRVVNPPDVVARMILARPNWDGLPVLQRVAGGPIFTSQGRFCGDPGYNPEGAVYLCLTDSVRPPRAIDRKQVRRAVDDLREIVQDFPFEDQASFAHCLAFTLLPFVRDLIQGSTPMHLFDAPKPGTGKTKLMTVCASIFSIEAGFLENAPESEDEWRKRLTSTFMEGSSHILLDDVKSLNSNSLQSALTNPYGLWKDRQLSKNENLRAPINVVWGVAGNNLTAKAELLRRSIRIRLNARSEHPEMRKDFAISNLEGYVQENRVHLMTACSTIIQNWIDLGQPKFSGSRTLGSYESWVEVMGGILESAGVEGFLENQVELLEQADEDRDSFRGFFRDWHNALGSKWVGVRDVLPFARRYFAQFDITLSDASTRVKLGWFLSKHRDVVHADLILQIEPGHDGNKFRLAKLK